MASRPGYKSLLYATLYERNDSRLAGYGNPPNDPEFQRQNPGAGCMPLSSAVIDDDPNNPGKLIEVN
jgi:hypothetical protein